MYILMPSSRRQCIYSATVTSGQTHIATVDAGAMLFHDSIDLSAYAGDDAGSTLYLMGLYNADGKAAFGYIGAVGGGLTLGDEGLANPSFDANTTGWTLTDCTVASVAGGQSNNCLEITRTGGYSQSATSAGVNGGGLGSLAKYSAYVKSGTSGNELFTILLGGDYITGNNSSGSWVQYSKYRTYTAANHGLVLRKDSSTAGTMLFDEASVKQVTDVAATGLHLHSTRNGTDRKMTSVTSGFNPNAITAIKIWRAL